MAKAQQPGKVSAFVKALKPAQEAVKVASETKRSSFFDNNDLSAMYKLNDGDSASFTADLVSCKADVHDKGDYQGLPYVSFTYNITSGPAKGSMISIFMPLYSRRAEDKGEITDDSVKWIMQEFQLFGYETDGWSPADIEGAANELNDSDEKPSVTIRVTATKSKSGKSIGKLMANLRVIKLLSDEEVADEEVEDAEEEEVEEDTEEATDSDDEEAEEEEEEETPKAKASAKSSTKYKVGDSCLFTDPGSGDTFTVQVTTINKGKYGIESDDFVWEDIQEKDLKPAPAKPAAKKKK